ncbi:MarR family transcriptional regulator [Deinococcus cavernae]|uniref:MarR family transcriptional regulator n=1 Tax=Deinococcus cavernae TaxID=2320857 RepID=A0A418VB61_9DEIO|nr:MarR family transcriptional regulator [Deinococcus cavernae]RJF73374.1 MarR family transcriptional regulator [Deinococcus cavernae]
MTAPLAQILQAIAGQPRTPGELARQLGTTEDVLGGMLRTLHAGGFVQEAQSGAGACSCGPCALKSLCRNAESDTPNLSLLRLTARGETYLRRSLP